MPRCTQKSVAEKICFVSNSREKCFAISLYDSILEKDLNEIEFILKVKGANPNYLLPEFGITPLHCAIGTGSEDHAFKVVYFCLINGGDPNVRCSEGTTPVLISALWNRLQVLKLLLSHGGDPFITDNDGLNAVEYALKNNHYSISRYLELYRNKTAISVVSPTIISRSDAVTQTTIGSKIYSYSNSTSDSYVSCDDKGHAESFPTSELTYSCSENNVVINESPHSRDNSGSYSMEFAQNNNINDNHDRCLYSHRGVDNSLLENGFICDNLSDMLSDISSNIDPQNTVSFYNDSKAVYLVSGNKGNSSYESSDTCAFSTDGVIKVIDESEVVTDSSISSYRTSCNWQDIAFIDHLPGEERKPTEELYTDDEAGIVLLQRNFPPDTSGSDVSIQRKKSDFNHNSQCSSEYDTDNLTNKLKECKIFSGPITKTTKKVYTRQLKRFIKAGSNDNDGNGMNLAIGSVLSRTFTDNYLKLIEQWSFLEDEMTEDFVKNSVKFKFKGGVAKCFFNYLLMDPRVTKNLPVRSHSMNPLDVWKTFIEAIFYVGKGKQTRPYAHLYEALKPKTRKPPGKKVLKVLDIWNSEQGVVCLMIFHNIISAEALTREAAMIDVLADCNITNAQGGVYNGIAAVWNMKQKCQLGAVLLHRALSIYLGEGERQISPPDLEVRSPNRF